MVGLYTRMNHDKMSKIGIGESHMTGQRPHESNQGEYVSFSEALALFGHNKNALLYRSRSGEIRTIKNEAGDTLYSIPDTVAAGKRLAQKHIRRRKLPRVEFGWIETLDDMFATLKLDKEVYGEIPVGDLNLYLSWIGKNAKIARAAYDAKDRGKIYAYITLLPLPEEVILDILLGQRDEFTIKPEEIEPSDKEGDITLLAESAVTAQNYQEILGMLLKDLVELWTKDYPRKRVRRIYAQGATREGGPLYILENRSLKRVSDAYVLDMDEISASRLIRKFQDDIQGQK
jgi:hypothetical protein